MLKWSQALTSEFIGKRTRLVGLIGVRGVWTNGDGASRSSTPENIEEATVLIVESRSWGGARWGSGVTELGREGVGEGGAELEKVLVDPVPLGAYVESVSS